MKRNSSNMTIAVAIAFSAGLCSHILYLRWSQPLPAAREIAKGQIGVGAPGIADGLEGLPVRYVPLAAPVPDPAGLPSVPARDVEKIRAHTGNPARVRGRVFRVGHSAKSNTYFLNFGPSREALTAVIFASALESFEKNKLPPRKFEGKEVEVHGIIKDHPQYGLEVILETPEQIKIVN